MKKLLIALLLICPTAFSAETVYGRHYEVEIPWDSNHTIVEFTPKGAPHMLCLASDGGYAGGITCFPKEEHLKELMNEYFKSRKELTR